MTNIEKLDEKLQEMRGRGFTGVSVFIGNLEASKEELAKDMLSMLDQMETATPMAELRNV